MPLSVNVHNTAWAIYQHIGD